MAELDWMLLGQEATKSRAMAVLHQHRRPAEQISVAVCSVAGRIKSTHASFLAV